MRLDELQIGDGFPSFIIKTPQGRRLRLIQPPEDRLVKDLPCVRLPSDLIAFNNREGDGLAPPVAAGRPHVLKTLEFGLTNDLDKWTR